MVRKFGQIAFSVLAMLTLAATNSQAQTVSTRHVREASRTGEAQAIGRVPASQEMQLDVVLPVRDEAGLKTLLRDVYDPTSFAYHRFLTPAEFTERFGPTQADYDKVVQYLKANGLEVVGGSRESKGRSLPLKRPSASPC
ncbi:MAG: protease pro-enzyme activation domain-containing protein [Terracidiphilus sp.]